MTSRLRPPDRKSTRLNSSHLGISYAVFCLKNRSDRKSTRLNSSHLGISYAVFCLPKRSRKHVAVYVGTGDGQTDPAPDTTDSIMALDLKIFLMMWRPPGPTVVAFTRLFRS